MPPASPQTSDTSHMLPEHATPPRKSGSGPVIGICIIIALLILGALYFWGAQLNRETPQLPLIPSAEATS